MWRAAWVAVAVVVGLAAAGCSSSNTTPGTVVPISQGIEITPEGTPGFVQVGSTRVQMRVPAGAVSVPMTFIISELLSAADLIAPLPAGRTFVGGLNFVGTAINQGALVEFRVPAQLSLDAGTPLQVFLADPRLPIRFFTPVADTQGNAIFTRIESDRHIPFATDLMGQFVFVTVP